MRDVGLVCSAGFSVAHDSWKRDVGLVCSAGFSVAHDSWMRDVGLVCLAGFKLCLVSGVVRCRCSCVLRRVFVCLAVGSGFRV